MLKMVFCSSLSGWRQAVSVAALAMMLAAGCSNDDRPSYMQKSKGNSGGSSFFTPAQDDIITDEQTGLDIIKNVINVTFSPETSRKTIEKIVASVKGEIVGYDYSVNFVQIRFKKLDLPAIDKMRLTMLGKYKEIESASRCPVSVFKNPYYVR